MQRGIGVNKNNKKFHDEHVSSKRLELSGYQLKKDVVLYVLNKTLLGSGVKAYDMVNRSLFEKYRCDISECYEKPEYLVDVLRYVFDGSYHLITESLVKNLERFADEEGIKEFLDTIRKEE